MADASFAKVGFESDHGIRCRSGPRFYRQTEKTRPLAHQRLALVFLSVVLLIGCDAIPRDSAGALTRVRGDELRVGMADNPPWVRFEGGRVAGFEPELIEAWAKELGTRAVHALGCGAE